MGEVIVVTSGKGGVGKTTTAANIAAGLARRGHKTAVVDFDVGLRNLDLVMGCERRVVFDFVNVIQGEASLRQALIKDKRLDNLAILPASQTRDKEALTDEGVEKVVNELRTSFDYVVCDSPAGIERGAHLAMYFADHAVVVVNAEVSSVRDADRMLGIIASKSRRAEEDREGIEEHLLVARYDPERVDEGHMMSLDDVQEILGIGVLGIVPECDSVLEASNAGIPVLLKDSARAGQAYEDVVARFLGEERPHRFVNVERAGFFKRLLGS